MKTNILTNVMYTIYICYFICKLDVANLKEHSKYQYNKIPTNKIWYIPDKSNAY